MSIEENLERIATALEKIAERHGDQPAKAAPPKKKSAPKKKAADKPADKPAETETTPSGKTEVPTTSEELKALVISRSKSFDPTKMAALGRMLFEDFKVSNIMDLPDEDFGDFVAKLDELSDDD